MRSSSLLLGALGVYREGAQMCRQEDGSAFREDEARAGVTPLPALPATDTPPAPPTAEWQLQMKCIHVCVKERKLIITYGLHFDGSVHNALCPITSESTVTFYFKTCCLGPSKSVS